MGEDTMAVSVSEETGTIEDVYGPYLIRIGFINRTPRGARDDAGGERAYAEDGIDVGI
jgi:Holliday junction resolvasome RuvABC ATP-dependent DNA helicase subunit